MYSNPKNMYYKFLFKKYILLIKAFFSTREASAEKWSDGYNYKWKRLRNIIKAYKVDAFIETGTYYGLTVSKLKNEVNILFSVEIDHYLYTCNAMYFRYCSNVHIILGDSSVVLPSVMDNLANIEKRLVLLFWLDGHCSEKETGRGIDYSPLSSELNLIKSYYHKFHLIVIIDDYRLFDGQDYPTLSEIVQTMDKDLFTFSVDSDACVFIDRRIEII